MSNRTVVYLAEKTGKKISEVEKLWRQCKREAKQVGKSRDYLFATSLLKQKLGFITELEEGKMKKYKGFQVEVESSTPDTSLVKIINPDNSAFGKLVKASGGLIAVPTRDLKEMSTAVGVGNGPARPVGKAIGKLNAKMKSGQKVKTSTGKYGYITVYGKTHSMVTTLDKRGNPSGDAKKISNRKLKAVAESKTLTISELSRRAASGEDADKLINEFLEEETPVKKPKSMPKVEKVLGILGIDVTEITNEMVEQLNLFLRGVVVQKEHRVIEKTEDCLVCSFLDEAKVCKGCANNFPSLFEKDDLQEELGDLESEEEEYEPEEPSGEADSSNDLDDSDMELVKQTVDPDYEELLDPEKMIAPDATPDAKEPIDEPPSIPAYDLDDEEEPPELEPDDDDDFDLIIGGEEDEEDEDEEDEDKPKKPEKILTPNRKESVNTPVDNKSSVAQMIQDAKTQTTPVIEDTAPEVSEANTLTGNISASSISDKTMTEKDIAKAKRMLAITGSCT